MPPKRHLKKRASRRNALIERMLAEETREKTRTCRLRIVGGMVVGVAIFLGSWFLAIRPSKCIKDSFEKMASGVQTNAVVAQTGVSPSTTDVSRTVVSNGMNDGCGDERVHDRSHVSECEPKERPIGFAESDSVDTGKNEQGAEQTQTPKTLSTVWLECARHINTNNPPNLHVAIDASRNDW